MSDSHLVKDFTTASGFLVPNSPKLMTKQEVHFLVKMMLDEIMELYATVDEPTHAKMDMIKMITESKDIPKVQGTEVELIAEQADAIVDCYYYSLNSAAKHGVNISSVFRLVHNANMSKKDPESGMFLRRSDGKIIKPDGWKIPDIPKEIQRQINEGSWHEHLQHHEFSRRT